MQKIVVIIFGALLFSSKSSGSELYQEETTQIYEAWHITDYGFFIHYFLLMMFVLFLFGILYFVVRMYQKRYSPFSEMEDDIDVKHTNHGVMKKSRIPQELLGPRSRL